MTKKYTCTCTRTIEFDFDELIRRFGINEDGDLKEECENVVRRYFDYCDDYDYWFLIEHESEIIDDLYNYVQSKK